MIEFRQKLFFAPLLGGILTKEVAGNLLVNGGAQAIGAAGQIGASKTQAKAQEKSDASQERIARQQNLQAQRDRRFQEQQAKQQAQLQKQQLEMANKQFKQSTKLARKTGLNVQPTITATQGQPQETTYSEKTKEATGFIKNLGTLAKERGLHRAMAGALVSGAITGGSAYAVDKAIQRDIKKSGNFKLSEPELTEEEKKAQKKKRRNKAILSGLGTATVVGSTIAAKKGKFGPKVSGVTNKYVSRESARKVGSILKDAGRDYFTHTDEDTGKRKLNKLSLALTGVSLASPAVMYKMKKKQYEDQVKQSEGNTEEKEKNYSSKSSAGNINFEKLGKNIKKAIRNNQSSKNKRYNGTVFDIPVRSRTFKSQLKNAVKKTKHTLKTAKSDIKKGWGEFKEAPVESTLGVVSEHYLGGGRRGVPKFGKDLEELGQKTGNQTSQKVGKFIQSNPKTALAGSIVVGGVAIRGARNKVWGTTNRVLEKVDPNAFAYSKYGAQPIPPKNKKEEDNDE